MPQERRTITLAKATVGGWAGDLVIHPDLLDAAAGPLDAALERSPAIRDYAVTHAGPSVVILLSHTHAPGAPPLTTLLREAFAAAARRASDLKLHGAGPPPTFATTDIPLVERASETFVAFVTTGVARGALNLPLLRAFADPFVNRGLVDDERQARGYEVEVVATTDAKAQRFATPEALYALLARAGDPDRYAIAGAFAREGHPLAGEAVLQTTALAPVPPAALARAGDGLPEVRDLLEPWARAFVARNASGRPVPVVPVGIDDVRAARGAARVVALGYTVANGELLGPVDLFADPAFDRPREEGMRLIDALR